MSRLQRDGDIDALRGLAALAVAALHTREITWVGFHQFVSVQQTVSLGEKILAYLSLPLVWGSIGVPIFFVLSGYCIHRGQAFARAQNRQAFSTKTFLLRRFVRIYPVLMGALVLTLLCDSISHQYLPNSEKLGDTSLPTFLINLVSLQGVAGDTYGSNGALWTLSIEVQFYLLYPVLLFIIARYGVARTALFLTGGSFATYFVFERAGYVFFLSYYISWYLGVWIAELEAMGDLPKVFKVFKFKILLYVICFALFSLGCAFYFQSHYGAFQIWAAAFALTLCAVIARPRSGAGIIIGRFLPWLGTFSYSIYITHVPVVVMIDSIVFHSAKQNSIVPFLMILAAAVVCAYAFFLIFEKPALVLSGRMKTPRLARS